MTKCQYILFVHSVAYATRVWRTNIFVLFINLKFTCTDITCTDICIYRRAFRTYYLFFIFLLCLLKCFNTYMHIIDITLLIPQYTVSTCDNSRWQSWHSEKSNRAKVTMRLLIASFF